MKFEDYLRLAEVGAKHGNPWFAKDKLERAWRSLPELPPDAELRARAVLELANRERDSEARPPWWKGCCPTIDVEHAVSMLSWEREHAFGVATGVSALTLELCGS